MSSYDSSWQQRELDRLLAQMRPALDMMSVVPPSCLESLRAFEDLSRKFSFPTSYLGLSDKILASFGSMDLIATLPSIYKIDAAAIAHFDNLQHQMSAALSLVDVAAPPMQAVSAAVAEHLARTEALAQSFDIGPSGLSMLLRANDSFQSMSLKWLALADEASHMFQSNTATLIAEAAQFLPKISYVSEMGALMAPQFLAEVGEPPGANIFEELYADFELIDLDDEATDVAAVVEGVSATFVSDVGGRLVQRVFEMNTDAERRGDKPVFKPTTKNMMAFHQVPSVVVTDESSFLEVVDGLYFLLYEGTGDGARLTERFSDERLESLWLLKHLRLGARHDLDHGSGSRKKLSNVGDAYVQLVGTPTPKSKAEWQRAQQALYNRVADMLDDLWFGER